MVTVTLSSARNRSSGGTNGDVDGHVTMARGDLRKCRGLNHLSTLSALEMWGRQDRRLKSAAVLTFFIFPCSMVTNVSTADRSYFRADRNSSALNGFCTYAAPS